MVIYFWSTRTLKMAMTSSRQNVEAIRLTILLFLCLQRSNGAISSTSDLNRAEAQHCKLLTQPEACAWCWANKSGQNCNLEVELLDWKSDGCKWNSVKRTKTKKANIAPTLKVHEGKSFCLAGEQVWNYNQNWKALERFTALFGDNITDESWLNIGIHHVSGYKSTKGPSLQNVEVNNIFYLNSVTDILEGFEVDSTIYDRRKRPGSNCKNPYRIEVFEIHTGDKRLHNHLHLRLFADGDFGGAPNCPNGKMKYVLLEVTDVHGIPFGEFDTGVPCHRSSECTNPPCYFSEHDHVICSKGYPQRVQPGMILITPENLPNSKASSDEGYKEIHVTWRFTQQASDFVKQIHFKALIVDNVEHLEYYSDFEFTSQHRNTECYTSVQCICRDCQGMEIDRRNETHPVRKICMAESKRPFGWMADYQPLNLTWATRGSYDFYRKRAYKPEDIDCNVPLTKAFYIPSHLDHSTHVQSASRGKRDTNVAKNRTRRGFNPGEFQQALPTIKELIQQDLCVCPKKGAVGAGPSNNELHARQIHATQMLLAWGVFVPFTIFMARYFKETYVQVQFFKYEWWLTVHILTAGTAMLFMVGGIYVIKLNQDVKIRWMSSNYVHAYCGWIACLLFVVHLFAGPFWIGSQALRIVQIFCHWFFGMLEWLLSVGAILSAGFLKWGYFPCSAAITYACYLGVVFLTNLALEIIMEVIIDKKLDVAEPRFYLPPPTIRLFHTDAPWSNCRVFTSLGYLAFLLGAYVLMCHFVMSTRLSCWEHLSDHRPGDWGNVYYDDYADDWTTAT